MYERSRCGLKDGMEIGAMAREWAGKTVVRAVSQDEKYSLLVASRWFDLLSLVSASGKLGNRRPEELEFPRSGSGQGEQSAC